MIYHIVIVDDDPQFLERFSKLLYNHNSNFDITTFDSLASFLQSSLSIDALFIDYELKDGTAFDYLESVKAFNFLCIIITWHSQIVFHSFQYQPFWFMRKHKLNDEFENFYIQFIAKLKENHSQLVLQSYNKTLNLKISSISYIEKQGNYLIIHSDQTYQIRYTFRRLLDNFDFSQFISPLYGVLIHPSYIKAINLTKRFIVLNNDTTFNISRKQFNQFIYQYQNYLLK